MHEDIEKFLAYCETVLARTEGVIIHHKYCLAKREKFLIERHDRMLQTKEISFEDCVSFIAYLREETITTGPNKGKKKKHNTLVEYVKSIRAYMAYHTLLGNTSWDINLFPGLKKEKGFRDCCKPEEYEAIMKGMFDLYDEYTIVCRNQLLIDIAYHTGLRRAELLELTFSNFEAEFFQFEIKRKMGYIDPVLFDCRLQAKVREYKLLRDIYYAKRGRKPDSDFIFTSLENRHFGKVLRVKYLDLMLAKCCDKLIEKGELKRRVHLHMFRHSFATNCVYAGLSQQAVSILMGHRSMSTTLKYYNLNNEYMQNEYGKVMDFLDKGKN